MDKTKLDQAWAKRCAEYECEEQLAKHMNRYSARHEIWRRADDEFCATVERIYGRPVRIQMTPTSCTVDNIMVFLLPEEYKCQNL